MKKEKGKEQLIDKVKKLLRLAEDGRGATPAEAAAAAAKAQALLLEHNLKMSDLGNLEDSLNDSNIEHETVDLDATYQTSRWHHQLLHRCSLALMCEAIYIPAKAGCAGHTVVIGKAGNIEVAKYFYQYLHRVIDTMACEYRDKWKEKMDKAGKRYIPDESSRVRIDFCLGATATVGDRLDAEYRKAAAETSTSTALVLVNDTAVAAHKKALFPKLTNTSSGRKVDGSARNAGMVAGTLIPLHKGVKGAEKKRVA